MHLLLLYIISCPVINKVLNRSQDPPKPGPGPAPAVPDPPKPWPH